MLCVEASLANDPGVQVNLISTVEMLEACGKHVLINYLPSHDDRCESMHELKELKGIEGVKAIMDDLRSMDSLMQEVGEIEQAPMRDELEELNKTADHRSIDDEKIIQQQTNNRSAEQDFEIEM